MNPDLEVKVDRIDGIVVFQLKQYSIQNPQEARARVFRASCIRRAAARKRARADFKPSPSRARAEPEPEPEPEAEPSPRSKKNGPNPENLLGPLQKKRSNNGSTAAL